MQLLDFAKKRLKKLVLQAVCIGIDVVAYSKAKARFIRDIEVKMIEYKINITVSLCIIGDDRTKKCDTLEASLEHFHQSQCDNEAACTRPSRSDIDTFGVHDISAFIV